MLSAEKTRFSIRHSDGDLIITAAAARNLWGLFGSFCWLVFIVFATMPGSWKIVLIALYLLSLGDCIRRFYVNDSVTVSDHSLSVRYSSGLFSYTKVYKAHDIEFVGFYPAFQGEKTSFGVAIIAKSRMRPLLYIQGQEAADAFEELSRIPWLAPKILSVERSLLFREKEKWPLKAAWSSLKALMSKPLRFP